MTSEDVAPVRLPRAAGDEVWAWASEQTIMVPESLRRAAETAVPPDNASAVVTALRLRAAWTSSPTSSRLPFSYQRVPQSVRTLIGRAIGQVRRRQESTWAAFPRWPMDLSVDALADVFAVTTNRCTTGQTPVLLTHDLDTAEGLRNSVQRFAPLEAEVGAVSAQYVVPCGWSLDHGLLRALADQGHELGIHGYDHGNKTPFSEPDELKRRLDASASLVDRYGMCGYRAPSLLRTPQLLDEVSRRFAYDSSIPTSGGPFPVPNNGCATARPFEIGALLELPLSLPRDGSLRFLGYRPDEILDIWLSAAAMVAASGGVVVLLTHCEDRFTGDPAMLSVYQRLLATFAADDRYCFALPRELVRDPDRVGQ